MNKELYTQHPYWKGYFINDLIAYYNKKTYLELGVWHGHTWSLVNCDKKTGVDTNPLFHADDGDLIVKTTDDYFSSLEKETYFDVIFIDAWHEKNQVREDFINSFKHLADDGIIVMHDINPPTESGTSIRAHGDCFEVWIALEERYRSHLKTMKGIDGDTVGLFFKRDLTEINLEGDLNKGYKFLADNRERLIGSITLEDFIHNN